MARRVIIDSTASSPFRVSVAGVDAASAQFSNLIFDANQMPLRLQMNGYMQIGPILDSDYTAPSPQNVKEATGPSLIVPAPSGSTSLFFCMVRAPFQIDQGGGGPVAYPGEVVTAAMQNSHLVGLGIVQPNGNPSSGQAGFKGGGGAICSNVFFAINFNPQAHNVAFGGFDQFGNTLVNYAIFKNWA